MKKYWILFFALACCIGCLRPQAELKRPGAKQTTLSLRKLTCEGCGARVVRALQQDKRILKLSFDKHKVELDVVYLSTQLSLVQLTKMVEELGFEALEGPGKGAYLPDVKYLPSMDVKWIAKRGESVSLENHLAKGKVTIFDFYAVWCGPCKDVDHALFALMKKHSKIALRKIDVVDWNRPVVKQHMSGVSQLPYLLIYDQRGKLVEKLIGRKIEELQTTLKKLLTP